QNPFGAAPVATPNFSFGANTVSTPVNNAPAFGANQQQTFNFGANQQQQQQSNMNMSLNVGSSFPPQPSFGAAPSPFNQPSPFGGAPSPFGNQQQPSQPQFGADQFGGSKFN